MQALADKLAEVEIETQIDTLAEIKPKPLVDALADTPAEVEA